jgi:hypothetical protein
VNRSDLTDKDYEVLSRVDQLLDLKVYRVCDQSLNKLKLRRAGCRHQVDSGCREVIAQKILAQHKAYT